jgi:transcriptional regulator GlxA family with amidase domain
MGGFDLLAYGAIVEAMGAANRHLRRRAYALSAIPHFGGQATSHAVGGLVPAQVKATTHIGERMDYDRLLVFSDEISAAQDPAIVKDARVAFWLNNLHQRGVHLVGVGAGSLVLASAGLGTHKDDALTTHPRLAAQLNQFIEQPTDEVCLAVHGQISSCAGGASTLDFALTLIAQDCGQEVAQAVGRMLIAPSPRHPASAAVPQTDEAQGNGSLRRMFAAMRNNLATPLTLQAVAKAGGVSVRQANRLFSQRTGRSTMDTYRRLRLDAAATLLRNSDQSVTQIALLTGFGGSPPLARHFKAVFGTTPRAFRANPALIADGADPIEQ